MINDIPKMIFIASGPTHMMAISEEDREIWAWGNNINGQLGIGEEDNEDKMQVIFSLF